MKILLADDDFMTCTILEEQLKEWNYKPVTASTGLEAWSILQEPDGPKMAILDWQMPGLSGLEVCQKLRRLQAGSYIYVVLLTGLIDKAQVVQGLEAGADDYLTKPCNPQELKVRLNNGKRILGLESELLAALSQLKQQSYASVSNGAHYVDTLTGRETEILRLAVTTNASNEEIAQAFHLGPDWVTAHLANITFKMQVKTPQEAIARAKADGLFKDRSQATSPSPVFG
jgi:DNA-binding response OmpR family regulator